MMNLAVVLWMGFFAATFAIAGFILATEDQRKTAYASFVLAVIHAIPPFVYLWTNLYTPVERMVE